MAISGQCECRTYPHPQCSACNGTITRKSEHIHRFRRNPWRDEAICGPCDRCACVAALPVIDAAQKLGLAFSEQELLRALRSNQIVVLAQGFLEICRN